MSPNLTLRLYSAIAMTITSVIFVALSGPIRNLYSTNCDPNNVKLHSLSDAPGVKYHPPTSLFSTESDEPDNNPLGCSSPRVHVNHYSYNPGQAYRETNAEYVAQGWHLDFVDEDLIPADHARYWRAYSRMGSLGKPIFASVHWDPVSVGVTITPSFT